MVGISLPSQLGVQAWLEGEGISWAWWVVGEAVGLRRKALQSRCGMSLEQHKKESVCSSEVLSDWHSYTFTLWVCIYLQQGGLHSWVVEATKGCRGGRGREAWYPRERQQARKPAASWRLESTTQPVAQRKRTVNIFFVKPTVRDPKTFHLLS